MLLCFQCAKSEVDSLQMSLTSSYFVAQNESASKSKLWNHWEEGRKRTEPRFFTQWVLFGLGGVVGLLIALSLKFNLLFTLISLLVCAPFPVNYMKASREKRYRNKCPEPPKAMHHSRNDYVFSDFTIVDPNGGTKLSPNYRDQILMRDQYACQWCGISSSKKDMEVHHIQPRSRGGKDTTSNLVTLCFQCHLREYWFGHKHMKQTKSCPI
jgi:hypothetical protein